MSKSLSLYSVLTAHRVPTESSSGWEDMPNEAQRKTELWCSHLSQVGPSVKEADRVRMLGASSLQGRLSTVLQALLLCFPFDHHLAD